MKKNILSDEQIYSDSKGEFKLAPCGYNDIYRKEYISQPKVINLSGLVNKPVWMKFSNPPFGRAKNGQLCLISAERKDEPYLDGTWFYSQCEILDHPDAWITNTTSECILPEGVLIDVMFEETTFESFLYATEQKTVKFDLRESVPVKAYRFAGKADGWLWPYEAKEVKDGGN